MEHEHFRKVCVHGVVYGQCRCPDRSKVNIMTGCPTEHWTLGYEPPQIYEVGEPGTYAKYIGPVPVQSDHDALVELIKRVSPIKHEPLATAVAEEWAAEFEKEGWHRG